VSPAQSEQYGQEALSRFMRNVRQVDGFDYERNAALYAELNAEVKRLASDDANTGKSFSWILQSAHETLKRTRGQQRDDGAAPRGKFDDPPQVGERLDAAEHEAPAGEEPPSDASDEHASTGNGTESHNAAAEEKSEQQAGRGEAQWASEPCGWPEPLSKDAFCGLAGEIVLAVKPHTEADPAALMAQVLVAFGALAGRGPHVRVEGDEHHGNLDVLLVGKTSKARKGTSWGRVHQIFSRVAGWPQVVSGLSSGEGLKFAVRDPIKRVERDKKTGVAVQTEIDGGVADKRLLVVEAEFAQVLRQAARAGNTLSATVRSAWDTGTLRTLTKTDPVTATGAHISIIGHITQDELRAELTATDSANGFANRFIFMCVMRSQVLPFGGGAIDAGLLDNLSGRIGRAADRARTLGEVGMTAAAQDVWKSVYPTLSQGYQGLFGAVTARSEAQCLRLALVYALMDGAGSIDRQHLLAGLAVWERAQDSARFIFGSALGDPVADEILRALRVAGAVGMTRTEISGLFKRNQPSERIGAALNLLAEKKLAIHETKGGESGRPTQVWKAV
jgi:hypothetical protein